MNALPQSMQSIFQAQIGRLRNFDIVKKIHDKTNGTTYFIHEFKNEPEVSYLDFLNNEFIPKHDYNNKRLMLRTDYDSHDMNYASTAYVSYANRYLLNREIHREIYDSNPREDGKVDYEEEI